MTRKQQPPPSLGQGGGENLGNSGKSCLPPSAPSCKHDALSNRLPILAAEIVNAHAEARRAAQMTVEHAIRAGNALLEAKALMPHGAWLPWLRDHCQMSERSAQRYIHLARNKDEISKNRHVSDLTLNAAALLLRNVKADTSDSPLEEPFTDDDFEKGSGWLAYKLSLRRELPEAVRILLRVEHMFGVTALALASADDLWAAGAVVAAWIKQTGKGLTVVTEQTESRPAAIQLSWAAQAIFFELYSEVAAREKLSEEAYWQRYEDVHKQIDAAFAESQKAFADAIAEARAEAAA